MEAINGVTKFTAGNLLYYTFPLATITVDAANNTYTLQLESKRGLQPQIVSFADITDKLGATGVEGYVDQLAINELFFYPVGALGATTE